MFGVYLHYPWCRKRCPYCDFAIAIAPESEIPHDGYLRAVLGELDDRAGQFAGRSLVSIYFGGGTPSIWPVEHLAAAIEAVRGRFEAPGEVEVTLEANPTDCTPDRIGAWIAAGINRLSIGVQSFDARELRTLGRDHRFGDGEAAVRAALDAGVPRVTGDVILGAPGRPREATVCDPSVVALADLDPGHVSIYELTIEPRTSFGAAFRRGDLVPLDEDDLADQYTAVHRELEGRGYEHYEVSSYARLGHRSVHNTLYWHGGEYLGLGNGAASFRRTDTGGVRWINVRSVKTYMTGRRAQEETPILRGELDRELLWLGLRTSDGVAHAPVELETWLVDEGLAVRRDGRIRPTLRGFLFADRVAQRVVANRLVVVSN